MEQTYTIAVKAKRTMFGKCTGVMEARIEAPDAAPSLTAEGKGIGAARMALINKLGVLAAAAGRHAYIYCGDGKTILVVYFQGECWGYDIIDPDRAYPSGCWMPVADFNAVVTAAKSHAGQSYGGVRKVI